MITDTINPTKSKAPPLGHVGKEEAERILRLLEAEIIQSRRSRRDIERKLGWSQGYLGSLLRGRISLKVWHVFALARQLAIEPLSLFLTVSPPRDPAWILKQLGLKPAPPEPAPVPPEAAPAEKEVKEKPPVDWEVMEEIVRKLLREELEKFGLIEIEPAPN